jgi:hypothetical protein
MKVIYNLNFLVSNFLVRVTALGNTFALLLVSYGNLKAPTS